MRCPKCNQEVEADDLVLALLEELREVDSKLRSIAYELPSDDFSKKLYELNNELHGLIEERHVELIKNMDYPKSGG